MEVHTLQKQISNLTQSNIALVKKAERLTADNSALLQSVPALGDRCKWVSLHPCVCLQVQGSSPGQAMCSHAVYLQAEFYIVIDACENGRNMTTNNITLSRSWQSLCVYVLPSFA
jgi:hypothetical protein